MRGYHPIRGLTLESGGQTFLVRTTPFTALVDPDGVQYSSRIPNLMREVVGKVGNVVDVIMFPPSKKINPPAVRMLQVRKLSTAGQ